MEDIKPKKERKFLKAVGKVAGILLQEFVLGLGRKFIGKKIDRIGNKRQALLIFLALFCNIAFASIDSIPYPITGNKQRLGWQTTANGLVYRGRSNDTITKPTNYVDKNVKAYLILDSVRGTIFVWRQTYWDSLLVGGGGGAGLTMPFDSITFNTAKDGTVGVGEVEYNDTQGSLIQGLKGGNVTNVIGQQLHQRVNNRTGATLNKGDVVYLSGSQGNRITVAKGLAVTDAFSANTFGVVAEAIANNASGFIITEGLITGLNTSALTEDSAVYLSPTVAGALTSTKPQAPQHSVYIGVCVKSNNGSGELFVKIRNGLELDELHDTRITNPVTGATLYYSGGLWRDTTAALLVSDTAAMLANYATKAYADTTGRFYARQDFSNVSSSTLTWTQSDTLIPGGVNVVQVYRNGQILLPSQYTIPTSTSVVIAATSYKIGENYTVIFPRGGGAGSGGGSGSLTSITAGTGITVSPNPITTTGTVSADLSVLMELTDTVSLSNRINLKLNATDTASLSSRIDAKGIGTVTSVASGYGLTGGTITTTGTLRLDSASVYNYIRDSIVDVQIGNDTIKILKQEYNNVTSDTLTWTITSKFPIQLRAYILLFRNGQLLINDQYSVIDTNKVKINSGSYKLGENYTVVTVSGIGSAGISQTGNPVYPEAGIALSTGTTWTTSIPNNSTNWNTAYTDRLKWDGGSSGLVAATGRTSLGGTTIGQSMFTLTNPSAITFPQFNADNTITALSASSFRGAIGAGTVSSVTASGTAGNPLSITNTTTTPTIELLSATTGRNGYLTSTDWTTFNNKQSQINGTGFVKASGTSITYDNSSYLRPGLADSTFLKLTGGTLTGNLRLSSSVGTQLNIDANDNNLESRITFSTVGSARSKIYTTSSVSSMTFESIAQASAKRGFRFISSTEGTQYLGLVQDPQGNVGIKSDATGNDLHPNTLYVNGTLGITGATTIGSTLAVTGATTLSTTTATPTVLLGKDGSNVVGAITLGSGLTLSSGTLTASGATGVTSVTATSPLLSSGGSTPNITITDASTTTSGVITTGTQSIAGAKTFTSATVINGGLVVNDDGSSVGTFRVEGDNNTSLIQTAPASDYVGIGRVPENSFDVQGAVRFRTLTLNGTPTRIIGADATGDINQITLGSGLSLSSGTLNATNTGTVTNVTGTLPISVANGTTTPSITIANASTSASGVVTTGTQSFAGNKTFTGTLDVSSTGTFGGRINTPWLERTYVNSTSSSFTVGVNTTWLDINTNVLTTLTLPNAATYPGKELHIRQTGSGSLQSASSNIIPFSSPPTGSTVTSILTASTHRAVTLVSDGTNWIIMQRSDI